jgi:hypothetical protein
MTDIIDIQVVHHPDFIIEQVEKHYSEKDGVEVKYVISSALKNETVPVDIYYRETPHPEFGNRYFGLYINPMDGRMYICNADMIEDMDIDMALDKDGQYHYSQHRHHLEAVPYIGKDGTVVQGGIDGGRAYLRTIGEVSVSTFRVKDGAFIEVA